MLDDPAYTFTGAALYCRAYRLGDLREFPDWNELRDNWKPERLVVGGDDDARSHGADIPLSADEIVFLHDDLTVTAGTVRGENLLFRSTAAEWRRFCIDKLGFRIPEDLLYRLKKEPGTDPPAHR